MIKCRRRQATDLQKLKEIVNGRFFVFCWWKRKRLKNNRFHIPVNGILRGEDQGQWPPKRYDSFFSSSYELFVVSFMQEDVYIGHPALALTHGLQVFS